MTDEARPVVVRAMRPPNSDGAKAPPKLFIATPAYGGMVTMGYAVGLAATATMFQASGLECQLGQLCNESLITRARNRLVADFLKTDCTHMLFIDADIAFSPRDVKALVDADVEACCGAYPMKAVGWQNVIQAAQDGKSQEQCERAGARFAVNLTAPGTNGAAIQGMQKAGHTFIPVGDAATGFLLLRREVITRFIDRYRDEIAYVADYEPDMGQTHHMVFQAGPDPIAVQRGEPPRYLSEDYWFSRKWQMMGGIVWLCLDVKLSHTGTYTFRGDIKGLFSETPMPAPSPVAAQQLPDTGQSVAPAAE